jgi:hypothetical protein
MVVTDGKGDTVVRVKKYPKIQNKGIRMYYVDEIESDTPREDFECPIAQWKVEKAKIKGFAKKIVLRLGNIVGVREVWIEGGKVIVWKQRHIWWYKLQPEVKFQLELELGKHVEFRYL